MDYIVPNTPLWCDLPENQPRFKQELARLERLSEGRRVEVKRLDGKAVFFLETPEPDKYQIYLATDARYPLSVPTVMAEHKGKVVEVKSATLDHWKPESNLAQVVKEIIGASNKRRLLLIGGLLGTFILAILLVGGFLVFNAITISENQINAATATAAAQTAPAMLTQTSAAVFTGTTTTAAAGATTAAAGATTAAAGATTVAAGATTAAAGATTAAAGATTVAPTQPILAVKPFRELVEAQWPTSMSSGSTSRVKVSFIRTSDQVYTPIIEITGQTAAVATPMTVGGTPGVPMNVAFPEEEGFLTANLSSLAFEIQRSTPITTYSLDQPVIVWQWDIMPKKDQTGKQTLSIDITAVWKSKEMPNAVIRERQVWAYPLEIEVYQFFLNSTQLLAFGVAGFVFGGILAGFVVIRLGRSKGSKREKVSIPPSKGSSLYTWDTDLLASKREKVSIPPSKSTTSQSLVYSASNSPSKFEETLSGSFSKKQELITLLLSCPSIENRDSRNNLLRGVHNGRLIANFARNEVNKIDVENIVNTLLDYSGDLEEFISFIKLVDSGTKAWQALETFIENVSKI
ncbi:MAG: hypothetical protein HXX20_11475 [Chloroflexi bacterium]|nr:hypothetical protein [Chloroflexota bacterium]